MRLGVSVVFLVVVLLFGDLNPLLQCSPFGKRGMIEFSTFRDVRMDYSDLLSVVDVKQNGPPLGRSVIILS